MTPSNMVKHARQFLDVNAPALLTATGVTGTVATAYLAARAAFVSVDVLRGEEEYTDLPDEPLKLLLWRAKHVWKLYIPAGVTGVATIGCILGANRIESRRTATALAAYSISERALEEYKSKVVEVVGENKERAIRDKIAEDRIANKPPTNEVLIIGPGQVLCCELYTGRYFQCDKETLMRAQNEVNQRVLSHDIAPLDDFYDLVGLSRTSTSNDIGWSSQKKLMALEFTSVLASDGRPCLAFNYNYTMPV